MQKLPDVDNLVNELSSKEGVLHVLVNNAGASWGEKFDTYPVFPMSQVSLTVIDEILRTKLGLKS